MPNSSPQSSAPTPPSSPRRSSLLLLGGLLVLGWVCYRTAMDYPFIQDDYHHIWQSRWHGWGSLPHILTVQLPFYRPVSNAWYFAIGDSLWGLNPDPYHVINILAYVVSAWCVARIGTRVFRSERAGAAAGVIFLTTVGHLLAIYWICVMTAGWLVFWFCVAWLCDRVAWDTGVRRWRVATAIAFTLCVFSNVTGFTLAAILTVSAALLPPRPDWRTLARHHWPLYAAGALWLVLQFVVLGWPDLPNYEIGAGEGGLVERAMLLALFATYAISPLYLIILERGPDAWLEFGGVCLVLLAFGGWRYRVLARTMPDAAPRTRVGLGLAAFVVAWGIAPYLTLQGHFAPYHIAIASVGVSLCLGWVLGHSVPRWAAILLLVGWLSASYTAIRAYEQREHDTQGIGWKATLAQNIVADVGGLLAKYPDMQTLVIIGHNEHLWWFFEHGHVPDLVYARPDLQVIGVRDGRSLRPAPGQVVVRYRNMHLELVEG